MPADLHAQRPGLGRQAARGRRDRPLPRRSQADRLAGRRPLQLPHQRRRRRPRDPAKELDPPRRRAHPLRAARPLRPHLPPRLQPGRGAGLELAAEGMARALEAVPGKVKLLTETTAGQGILGHTFEQLAVIRERIPGAAPPHRGLRRHLPRLRRRLRPDHRGRLRGDLREARPSPRARPRHAFHLNDSKKGLGSRVDRHEHIGEGLLGPLPVPPAGERPAVRRGPRVPGDRPALPREPRGAPLAHR